MAVLRNVLYRIITPITDNLNYQFHENNKLQNMTFYRGEFRFCSVQAYQAVQYYQQRPLFEKKEKGKEYKQD